MSIPFFFLVADSTQMQAQSPAFYHLSTAEGLSDNNVNHVARDRNGILWIATTEGLNSFDGNRIKTYHKYNHPELGDNNIGRFVIDAANRIWLRSSSPYVTMLDEKRKFHKYPVGDSSETGSITALIAVPQGVIAVKNRKHYLARKGSREGFEYIPTPFDGLLASSGFTQYLDDGRVIYHRNGRLVVADYGAMKITLDLSLPGLKGACNSNSDILYAFDAPANIFYRISISQQKITDTITGIRDQAGLPIQPTLRNMCRIDENRFAFSNYFSGLYIIDFSTRKALHYFHDPIDPRSIGGNNTFDVRYDSSGYLFATTQTSGVHFFNLKQQQASSKPYFIDENKQIFDGYVHSITTDADSNVWMGAQDRLIRWNRATDKTSYVPLYVDQGKHVTGIETIRKVDIDEEGRLWVGSSRFGVLVLNKQLQIIQQLTDSLPGKKTLFPSAWINAICADQHGNRWVGTLRGTCIVRAGNFEILPLTNHPLLGEISNTPCASLWNDGAGKMWIGTTRGAWCYDEKKNSLKQYSSKEGLAHNTVYAIQYDHLGNTYFATAGGLSILDKNGQITSYNRSNGLRNDRCEGILKDEEGFLWIGNLNCILRYDPVNKKFAVYEEGPGFSHGGFRMRTAHKSRSGEMFWGTDKGLTYFFPAQMAAANTPIHPSVNALRSGNSEFNFTREEQLAFPHTASSFTFHFSSGELTGDKKNQFQYRLRGFDKDWQSPATTGQAVYSKLPPGSYIFLVRASRDGIAWVDAPFAVTIRIRAPWWQQTWFRLLLGTAALASLYALYRYRRNRRRNREIQKTITYFANSSYEKSSADEILWDICRNCIARLGFEDCVIYTPDHDRKVLLQKAAYGPKSSGQNEISNPIEIPFGKGIVGDVALSGKPSLVTDTSKDSRYIVDDERRFSELTVPVIHEGNLLAVIDSEHPRKRFFSHRDLEALRTIASLCSAKIARSMAMEAMQKSRLELMELNVKMAEAKFLNLRLQMNPHFLFNSLSAIQHLIVTQQTNKAYKYLTVFSNFLRSLLNFAEKNFIPLDEELKILRMYVELESLRFDDSFQWEITADESLDHDEVLVPSLMVQPFAENAIWHGLLHKEGHKKISVRFTNNSEDYMSCVIEDNGVGREKATAIRQNKISSMIHESKGIGIIRERLALLEQKTGKPARVEMQDLYDAEARPAGTRVTITIPYYNPEES